jgi:hypothetical protein
VGEKEIVEGGTSTGTGGGATGGSTTGGGLVDPMPQGGGGSLVNPGGPKTTTRDGPSTVAGDPCKELTDKANQLLGQLQALHDMNRDAMQRALSAFFGPKSSQYNEGYAHYFSMAKITEAVVDANNATGKALIDVALFAAGGWGGIAGEGSTAAKLFGKGIQSAADTTEAWGKVGMKVLEKVGDLAGHKEGKIGTTIGKTLATDDPKKIMQPSYSALESVVRGAIIDALGDWMKDGATSGDIARAQAAYADFCAAAASANTTSGSADGIKQQLDDINKQLRARNCPEVTIPDYAFYTFDISQFGQGMFRGETNGPTMHTKYLVSGGDRATDLFAKVNDTGSLPF